MPYLPPDLPRLRTLRTWHAMWVERIDDAVATVEQRYLNAPAHVPCTFTQMPTPPNT